MAIVKPSVKQINFAKSLGLEIEDGISRSQLSKIIEETLLLRSKERLGAYKLPDEDLKKQHLYGLHSESYSKKICDAIRMSPLKSGLIVMGRNSGVCYVVVYTPNDHPTKKEFYLRRIVPNTTEYIEGDECGCCLKPYSIQDDGTLTELSREVVYTPQEGFQHSEFFLRRLPKNGKSEYYLAKRRALVAEAILKGLADSDKYENQYGKFWRESTVNYIMIKVLSDVENILEQNAKNATKPKSEQYCLVCGAKFEFRKRMTRNGLCREHRHVYNLPTARFCTWCGTKFELNKTGTVYLCNSCKSKFDTGARKKY